MILADKIIEERKKNGWSQEELAEKLDVSRQSVSKWEGAQSTPDLQKILKMSELFGVSTDYLLKDEIENTEYVETADGESDVRRVSMEEANAFLETNTRLAPKYALAAVIFILSPVCLLVLGGMSETGMINEDIAGGIGMIVLILLTALGTVMLMLCGKDMNKYEYLGKEIIETAYGVSGMVKGRQNRYETIHSRDTIIGAALCIIGAVALFTVPVIGENDLTGAIMLSVMLAFEAIGSFFLIRTSNIKSGFDKLLQEGDYNINKKKDDVTPVVSTIYWLAATAVFLTWSFTTNSWELSWIVWVIAGILYPALLGIIKLIRNKK